MVIQSHPRLEDGTPFPTLYWLTCPVLNKRISALESSGWMRFFNGCLLQSASLRDRLAAAISSYCAARDRLHKIEDQGGVPGGGPDRIKCVHAHGAHHLVAGTNPVGASALAETGWPDCREACYKRKRP